MSDIEIKTSGEIAVQYAKDWESSFPKLESKEFFISQNKKWVSVESLKEKLLERLKELKEFNKKYEDTQTEGQILAIQSVLFWFQ